MRPNTPQVPMPSLSPQAAPETQWRVVETKTGRNIAPGKLLASLTSADAVFVGEQHDDPETHRLEEWILTGLHRRNGKRVVLAMEMFERDQQGALDRYLAGLLDETAFAKAITLWRNYPTDYRPMIEYARKHRIPVVASNAPVAHVRKVGREGLAALDNLPLRERMEVATQVQAPMGDTYQRRFFETMLGMGQHGPGGDTTLKRTYEAQCLRDDTMAESVARALVPDHQVIHVNGSFHSDAGLGTVARLRWRRPIGVDVRVVKAVPVKGSVERAAIQEFLPEADFLVFVPDLRPENPVGRA